ncbi:MAG: glycosyltransferase family 39 protein [Hyphomicrobiales bacterium]|nr:glycosyltransferase family 39 protein [Hyphomicrobiales bacterium]
MTQYYPGRGAQHSSAMDAKSGLSAARYTLWLTAALAALGLWRIVALYLSNTELFFDEAQYWAWSEELDFGYYSKPPFIAWLIRAATEVCGDGEFCIRLPSPIIHTFSSILVFLLARRLFDARTGFWAALTFATLPGISFSAGLISTDVPLLFFWTAALFAFVLMLETRSWAAAAALGLAFGFGMLSKYAMGYFVLCAALYAVWAGEARRLANDPRVYAALGIAALVITPNMIWNFKNQFATFSHTADNAKWGGSMFNIGSALEFFAAQAGVFGVILFGGLIWTAWRLRGQTLTAQQKLLFAFSAPVILLITGQALLSRAHANWAAVAYVAATILVVAEFLRSDARRLLQGSLALHIAALVLVGGGNATAGRFTLPGGMDPYERVLGWKAIAEETDRQALAGGFKAVAVDKRSLTAELIYYMRSGTPVVALRESAPRDHFELSRPVTQTTPEPILFVSFKQKTARLAGVFQSVDFIGSQDIKAGKSGERRVYFFRLAGFKGK